MTKPSLDTIALGDTYALMSEWPDAFIDTTVTSPPYWLQRQYLPDGHILQQFEMGQETTIERYIADLAQIFAQVHRITKPGGTCWVNIGDKIAGPDTRKEAPDYANGELIGLPWMFSDAMRRYGWRRVREIIWNKPNINPSASGPGPTIAHEHVFLFVKGKGHYYDGVATAEPSKYPIKGDDRIPSRRLRSVWDIPTVSLDGRKLLADICEDGRYYERDDACPVHGIEPTVSPGALFDAVSPKVECTCMSMTVDFFAAMPPRLAERCILATTSEVGNCPDCGTPYRRLLKKERIPTRPGTRSSVDVSGKARRDPRRHVSIVDTIGWGAGCTCGVRRPVPALVFDPFAGSGTTPMVARALGRSYLACELNPSCALRLAPARIAAGWKRTYAA